MNAGLALSRAGVKWEHRWAVSMDMGWTKIALKRPHEKKITEKEMRADGKCY
jgi:hypothetical protein